MQNQVKGFCEFTRSPPVAFVIFGASGDLANKKLLPSLFNLFQKGILPQQFYILGIARTDMKEATFRGGLISAIQARVPNAKEDVLKDFLQRCFYLGGSYDSENFWTRVSHKISELNEKYQTENNLVVHLSTPPNAYQMLIPLIANAAFFKNKPGFRRIIIEKPFGVDLESALKLNELIKNYFTEEQIYRIDHYLGKDTVLNLLTFRFANSIFESMWNRNYIDHVQITLFEKNGVESRAKYFESTGLIRDVFQNHLLQLMSLVAIEPPTAFDSCGLHNEILKVLESIRCFEKHLLTDEFIRGQYGPGEIDGKPLAAYRNEDGVDYSSFTETFFAGKFHIDNWRWTGVPFYVRAGKRMPVKTTEISIVFKPIPYSMFAPLKPSDFSNNVLTFKIQDEQSIHLKISAKHPGGKLCLTDVDLGFNYNSMFSKYMRSDYEVLLLDAANGDQTLFMREDVVNASWKVCMPILENLGYAPTKIYPIGTFGPKEAHDLIEKDGRSWILK